MKFQGYSRQKYQFQTKKNQVHYNFFFKESSSLQNGEADWADCYTQAQQIRSTDRTLRFTPIEATTLRGVARGGGRGGRSVNPIQTREADYAPHTTANPLDSKSYLCL